MSGDYHVFDGTDDTINCTGIDHVEWSYNAGVYLHGAAAMYNATASDAAASSSAPEWAARVAGLVDTASRVFFSPSPNATGVMLEQACERARICNTDQASFKGYLARWMAKAAVLAPFISGQVAGLLANSSLAAAQSCTGGGVAGDPAGATACGTAWWTIGYDGETGLGQQLSALETVQALLIARAPAPAVTASPPSTPPPISPAPSSSTPLTCPSANNTTYTSSPSSDTATFTIECDVDRTGGDLAFAGAATLADCIDACAAAPSAACVALAFEPPSAPDATGPCWLKGSVQPARVARGVWGAVRVGRASE